MLAEKPARVAASLDLLIIAVPLAGTFLLMALGLILPLHLAGKGTVLGGVAALPPLAAVTWRALDLQLRPACIIVFLGFGLLASALLGLLPLNAGKRTGRSGASGLSHSN